MPKICPKCGTENTNDVFWCENCKTKLVEKVSVIEGESQPVKDIELARDEKLRNYVKSLQPEESRIGPMIRVFKIPLI